MSNVVTNNINPRSGDSISINGSVSIGGTLTYEDVTNIDSVGIITAQSGIEVIGGNVHIAGVGATIGVATAYIGSINDLNYPTAGPLSNRNLLYNGAATVYQRGQNTSISSGNDNFATDRWVLEVDTAGTWTFSQSTDAPSGFGYSHKLDCTTANSSLSAGSVLIFQQRLEGQDLQNLCKGTADAKELTLSFYVKSAKTGTYIVEFLDVENERNCQRSYTINTADTWEYKTLTVPGDTTGALSNNNGYSFAIRYWLAAGSNFTSGTLQTDWGTIVNVNRVVGQVNLADSNSNDWYITGVQLEVGSKATPFEHRSFHDEQLRCMRYFQYFGQALSSPDGVDDGFMTFANFASTSAYGGQKFIVPMRARPSFASNNLYYYANTAVTTNVTAELIGASYNYGEIRVTGINVNQGGAGWLRIQGTDAFISFSAEF